MDDCAKFISIAMLAFAIGKIIQLWFNRNKDNDDHNDLDNHGFI